MKIKRLLALTLAAWMVCSMAVSAADGQNDTATGDAALESIAHVEADAPIDYIKIDTKGMPPEDIRVVKEERAFNFYAGDKILLPLEGSYVQMGADGKTRLAMNTTPDQEMVEKYPHANLLFLNGNGGALGKGATMRIPAAGGRKYLYRYISPDHGLSGDEWDLSNTYDAEQDAFVFPAETLGSYLLSDADLTDENSEFYFTWIPPDTVNSKTNHFADFLSETYTNRFAIFTYGTKMQKMTKPVTFRKTVWVIPENKGQVDMKRMRVYIFDETRNKLVLLPNAKPAYDTRKKELSFTSDYRGMFVITDSNWKRKTDKE